MEKFVYSYERTDGYTYSFTEYITFEAESKELLEIELTCALVDFQKNCEKVRAELVVLDEKREIARYGKHKVQPDMELLRKLTDESNKLSESLSYFEFKGEKYDFSNFSYHDYDKKQDELIDVGNNLIPLDAWFDNHR